MLLKVKVHPSSKRDEVLQKSLDSFEVFVRAKPIEGKATEAMLIMLSEFLKTSRSRLRVIKGLLSHNKIVEFIE